jgi:hypothetical protein
MAAAGVQQASRHPLGHRRGVGQFDQLKPAGR